MLKLTNEGAETYTIYIAKHHIISVRPLKEGSIVRCGGGQKDIYHYVKERADDIVAKLASNGVESV